MASTHIPIVFQNDLPLELTCPFCDQAFRGPVTTSCGHDFCADCIQPHMTCKVCNSIVETVIQNIAKQRAVQSLLVYCTFRDSGCVWEGILKQLQGHVDKCALNFDICSNCSITLKGQGYDEHVKKCQVVTCDYCDSCMKFSAFERHLQKCPKVLISCSFLCGLKDRPREEVMVHQLICQNTSNSCPFVELGCNFLGNRESVQKHLAAEPVRHLLFMCDEATTIKRYFQTTTFELDGMQKQHTELCQKIRTCEKIYGPQLVWKIEDAQSKTNEAKSGARPLIFSPAFVSGRFGYKLIASCNLFGDGPSRGEYISIYVALLRGEYDPVLEWPFQHTVRFSLLDQNPVAEERTHVSFSVDTRRIADSAANFLDQPIGGRNAAFGAQRFCTIERVQEYIKNDTLFIQIEIEEPSDCVSLRPSFRETILFNEMEDN